MRCAYSRYCYNTGIVLLLSVIILSQCVMTHADDLQIIRNNGHLVSGDLDSKTNQQKLWIQKRTPKILLSSSFDWNDVQEIVYQGEKTSPEELLKKKPQVSKAAQQREMLQFWFLSDHLRREPDQVKYLLHPTQTTHVSSVKSVQFDAYVANWDSDVEADGLIVHIRPIDAHGRVVAVNGQVDFKLIGQRFNRGVWRHRSDEIAFPQLESWSQQISKKDFGPDGAAVKLIFRKLRPEKNIHLAPVALLTGSLGVSGVGKFHASVPEVDIRPLSIFRDELQLRSKTRSRYHRKEYIRSR